MLSRWWAASVLALTACEASFEDLRPEASLLSVSTDAGSAASIDAGLPDLGGGTDAATPGDLGPGPDAGLGPDLGAPTGGPREGAFARGTWVRVGYAIGGGVELHRTAVGLELRLGDDFRVAAVPGPVLVLTRRPVIGSRIDPSQGDVRISELRRNSGAQIYALPEGADDPSLTHAFVYCEPFGLEVGRAALSR